MQTIVESFFFFFFLKIGLYLFAKFSTDHHQSFHHQYHQMQETRNKRLGQKFATRFFIRLKKNKDDIFKIVQRVQTYANNFWEFFFPSFFKSDCTYFQSFHQIIISHFIINTIRCKKLATNISGKNLQHDFSLG